MGYREVNKNMDDKMLSYKDYSHNKAAGTTPGLRVIKNQARMHILCFMSLFTDKNPCVVKHKYIFNHRLRRFHRLFYKN